jgi:hypothetical protein
MSAASRFAKRVARSSTVRLYDDAAQYRCDAKYPLNEAVHTIVRQNLVGE